MIIKSCRKKYRNLDLYVMFGPQEQRVSYIFYMYTSQFENKCSFPFLGLIRDGTNNFYRLGGRQFTVMRNFLVPHKLIFVLIFLKQLSHVVKY